jgi:hypothetical protein
MQMKWMENAKSHTFESIFVLHNPPAKGSFSIYLSFPSEIKILTAPVTRNSQQSLRQQQ